MSRISITISILVIAIICVVGVLVSFGYYPIALVNGTSITSHDYQRQLDSSSAYRDALAATYPLGQAANELAASSTASSTATPLVLLRGDDLGAAVLDTLVENILVHEAVTEGVDAGADRIVADKVAFYRANNEIARASTILLGISPEVFTATILVPQAEREVLASKLFLQGTTLEQWLRDQRMQARVRVLSSTFRWDGAAIRIR